MGKVKEEKLVQKKEEEEKKKNNIKMNDKKKIPLNLDGF